MPSGCDDSFGIERNIVGAGSRLREVEVWHLPTYDIQDTWKPERITHFVVHSVEGELRCENIITVLSN